MRFVFIDEVEQQKKNPDFFGLGIFIVDSFFYSTLHSRFHTHFNNCGWNKEIEFKGRYLFSKKGDSNIDIDKRIQLVDNLAEDTVAKKNSRCKFIFFYNFKKKTKNNYLDLVKNGLNALDKTSKKGGKNLVSIYYDDTDLVTPKDLNEITDSALSRRGLLQVEIPCNIKACYKSVGIIYSDVLSYLKSWDVLTPRPNDGEEANLFELEGIQRNKEKLAKIKGILTKIKSVYTKQIN